MTLEQLRIFIAVAELEHMTRAADVLHLSQSAVSAAIATLEDRHGVALFHRVGRRIELTEIGAAFLGEARAVLARAEAAEQVLGEFGGLVRGRLRLVASQTIAGYWLPGVLARFRARYPRIDITLAIANSEGAAAQAESGEAELGFVEGRIHAPALSQQAVAQDRLVLIAPPGMAVPERVDAGWLARAPWILREPGSGTRSSLEEILRSRGIDPDSQTVALTLPSNAGVLSAVEAGAGVAVLSERVVARAVAGGSVRALEADLPARAFHALRHRDRSRSRAAGALLDLIREMTS
ncbi:LysR family transcriptional regulator (plasmid) [Paroceanicella profunda]|uniref:LysR family transcriptional regulator n=1 Tax=Paroceanicella profunda TaxID=2579971 RepID=A0A5B8FJJ0_9RHOB|nr:LysR family transcriptional regulator [Paroceanicella profunda]QDL94378.1 LysR family transcriptional regulator [Paroceanicella profunda]